VSLWFLHNDLQLNADKFEVVILGTAPQLRSAANIREVEVAGSRLQVMPNTIRRKILPYCGHLHTTPQDPSVQTVLLTWCHQRLCIFGLYGAIQMLLLSLLLFIDYKFLSIFRLDCWGWHWAFCEGSNRCREIWGRKGWHHSVYMFNGWSTSTNT